MYYDQKESGKRIAALRKEKGLTQEQLAEKLNISTSTLGKIERGIQGFSIDLLIEIGIFLTDSTFSEIEQQRIMEAILAGDRCFCWQI